MMQDYERVHGEVVQRLAPECAVLLKRDGSFPLKEPCKLALYGPGARHTVKGGTGSGEVNSRTSVSIEEGLKQAGFEITTKPWLDAWDETLRNADMAFVKEIRARARKHRTLALVEGMGAVMPMPEYSFRWEGEGYAALYVVSRNSGEGADRRPVKGDILLTDSEIRDILWMNHRYAKFMLVLNVGGPVDLSPVKNVRNILLLSQLGAQTGTVLADLLLGKSYPSGKLATTWSAWEDFPKLGDFGELNETQYREGIYVGYRYFDAAGKKPLFPFGFGLGYTDFDSRVETADKNSVTVTVANSGAYPGKETVQLWLAAPQGKLNQPPRKLLAFAKTKELAPGETETLTVPFDMKDGASYDEDNASWILEAGDYTVLAGETPAVTLTLDQTVILAKLRSALGKPGFSDWKPAKPTNVLACENRILISASDFVTELPAYDRESEVEPAIEQLPDEALALLNVGYFPPKGGIASMIGNASATVPGAAGETAHTAGLEPLVMADGPAGLRLARQYYEDEHGKHPIGETLPESFVRFLAPWQRKAMALVTRQKKPTGTIQEQNCTAIPIGTAIAQSWNPALAEELGSMVGEEMERFGVRLWLAPALNLHRDIRCGRNFEYFSEDPLIAGKMAAALTRGVQKHPGRGVTVKHFAANNQEYNRTGSDSRVSERALRELYLKGFEICVRESQPHALMTSYNLLNGTHTSERRDLTTDILRAEWGFRGIVMTDWVVPGISAVKGARHRNALSDRVAAAGGDLFMPGSRADAERLLKALKAGSLTRRQLEENASRLCRVVKKLTNT